MPHDPTITFGDDLEPLVIEHHLGASDQRAPYLSAAYIEWEGERPQRCVMRFSLTCHQCGEEMTGEWAGIPGFIGGQTDPCPSCGNRVEIGNFRAWERGIRPGLIVFAMPYTASKGAVIRPIEIRTLEMTAEG